MDFQAEKHLVMQYYDAIEAAGSDSITDVLARHTSDNWLWRGYHPFNEQTGAQNVADAFWRPFLAAFTAPRRRQDVFFAGLNEMDGFASRWVASMGHLVGLFDVPFLDIPPTGKMAFFRYAEFNRVEGGRILETAFFFDLPHLMLQAGVEPFADYPSSRYTAANLVQPGPRTHDGILDASHPAKDGETTLALINAMGRDIGQWQSGLPLHEELARTWHDDMIWWGPTGIGAAATIPRYAEQHAAPFRAAFGNKSGFGHICRMAEGNYGGFFGWPNFTATLEADFLGVRANGARTEFRVIDIYRRDGDKLAENWVFIDFLHWLECARKSP